jgi:hypothetical protein
MAEANKTYVGVVEDNEDPKKMGRVKVRVMDVFDEIEVEDIPWAMPWKDLNGNEFNIPEKGKVVMVVFDQGNQDSPEFIYADHYNINLEKKLESLSQSDYISMKSLIFDHKTQIYVNDSEGLKIDHKYNNINITENTIDLNLKDNNRSVNIGDAAAGQQAILGNHWMNWFDEFVDNLLGANAGPFLGNLGAPVIANPAMISCLLKYKALRDPVFLSHHVNIVDNNQVKTVASTKREDDSQSGDKWVSTKEDNELTTKTNDNFKPEEGPKKQVDETDPEIKSENQDQDNTETQNQADVEQEQSKSISKINPLVEKLINFLKSKEFNVYEENNILNIIAMRTKEKEITNKFDDILYVFYKKNSGDWEIDEFSITTVPGFKPLTKEEEETGEKLRLPDNSQILAFGQYSDIVSLNVEKETFLLFEESAIYINDRNDQYNYRSRVEQGKFDIRIKVANSKIASVESVNNYAKDGSQVFKINNQFNKFINLCKSQLLIKNKFTYTLCRKSEFDDFV